LSKLDEEIEGRFRYEMPKIILDEPHNLFNYSNLGFQAKGF